MAKSVRELVATIRFNDEASKSIDKVDKKVDQTKESAFDLGNAFHQIAKSIVGLSAINFAKDLVSQSVLLAAEFEQTQVAFETMLGSADKAAEVLNNLEEFSLVTPFEPEQVLQAGKSLLAFGFQSEELVTTLTRIGDVASGVKKDFNELALIYGKARTSGKIFAEDLNQLTEAGIPILKALGEAMGVQEDQIRGLASSGQVAFKDLESAFQIMTSEGWKFNGMMEKQSKTALGLWSTMKGYGSFIGRTFGTELLNVFKPMLELFTELTGSFVQFLKTEEGLIVFRLALIALLPVVGVMLVIAVKAAAAAFLALAPAAWAAITPLLPFIALALAAGAAIAFLVLVVQDLVTWFQGGESAIGGFIDEMREAYPLVNAMVEAIKTLASPFTMVFGLVSKVLGDSAPEVAGARASGGPVSAGKSYLVGEGGPELFTPGQSGSITPNGGGGMSVGSIIENLTIIASSEDVGEKVKSAVLLALNELSEDIFPAQAGIAI